MTDKETVYSVCSRVVTAALKRKGGWCSIVTNDSTVKEIDERQVNKLTVEVDLLDRHTAKVTVKERAMRCSRWYTRTLAATIKAETGMR